MQHHERLLTVREHQLYAAYFPQAVLHRARIIEGHVPFWLFKNMCGVVLGHRIYFRNHAYQANSAQGVELLGHELTHVKQYADGMNVLKYLWASRHGYRQNPYEIEAYAQGAKIRSDLLHKVDLHTS